MTINRRFLTVSALSAAIGLAAAIQAVPDKAARADDAQMEKCYGINAVGKNDCSEGNHSCAGQATKARDPGSFVLVPKGTCGKIDGGSTTAM